MKHYKIACIVEGHGEVQSLPDLVDRWIRWRRLPNFSVHRPAIRAAASGAFLADYRPDRQIGIEYYVGVALRYQPQAILIVRDADDECVQAVPNQPGLGPRLAARAQAVQPNLPIGVVIANREFEAWALASLSRLRKSGIIGKGQFYQEAHPIESSGFRPIQPERRRDCKGPMGQLLQRPYSSSIDQARLVQQICFTPKAFRRSPSLGKLSRELERITQEARRN